MKKTVISLLLFIAVLINSDAQNTKEQTIETKKNLVTNNGIFSGKDSILPVNVFTDSTEFVSNLDLYLIYMVIKKVMTSQQYVSAGDVISQFEILVANINAVLFESKKKWEKKKKMYIDPDVLKKEKLNSNK